MLQNLLATEIVVVPSGAPRVVYGLSVIEFECGDGVDALYARLRAGNAVELADFHIIAYEKERPSLLLTDHPLRLEQKENGQGWFLTMP